MLAAATTGWFTDARGEVVASILFFTLAPCIISAVCVACILLASENADPEAVQCPRQCSVVIAVFISIYALLAVLLYSLAVYRDGGGPSYSE